MAGMPPLSPWQQKIWNSQKQHWLLFAGRRKGKSRVCWQKGVQYCLYGRTTAWYCASQQLADENWQDVVEFCSPFATRVNKEQKGIMEFATETTKGYFKRKSGWGTGSVGRAGRIDFVIFDEAQLMAKALYNRVIPSLATQLTKKIAMTLTPPETPAEYRQAQWLKDIIDTADENGNSRDPKWRKWLILSSPTEPEDIAFVYRQQDIDSGAKQREWKEYVSIAIDTLNDDREIMGDEDFAREYLLKWSLATNSLVYDNFRDGYHCMESYEYDPNSDVRWAMDRGGGVAYNVVLFFNRIKVGERGGMPIYKYRVFDEYASHGVMGEDEVLYEALTKSAAKNYRPPSWVFYDSRAPVFRNAILDAGLNPYTMNVHIESGIKAVRRTINRNLLEVHPRCRQLRKNICSYMRLESGDPEDKNNDAADALRYGVFMSERLDGGTSIGQENKELVMGLNGSSESDAVMLLAF